VSSELTIPWRRNPPVLNFSFSLSQLLTAPVSSNGGCERIAPVTHQDQAISGELPSPWRLCRPMSHVMSVADRRNIFIQE
jgi:phosphoribosylformylglycinamidine (FGAM) synthase-like amidotransferase family enzyme